MDSPHAIDLRIELADRLGSGAEQRAHEAIRLLIALGLDESEAAALKESVLGLRAAAE